MSSRENGTRSRALTPREQEAEARLAESRRRLQSRFEEIGDAVDREVETAQAIRDGFVAVLGVAGVLLTARQVAKSVSRKRKRRKSSKSRKKRKKS